MNYVRQQDKYAFCYELLRNAFTEFRKICYDSVICNFLSLLTLLRNAFRIRIESSGTYWWIHTLKDVLCDLFLCGGLTFQR